MESSELDPIRSVIERSVEARASKLQRSGHISTTHPAAPLEERWSLIAADAVAVGAPFRPGNWGQSQMLDKSIYDLLTDRRLTDIAATVVGQNVAAHGDYWIRPSTKVVAASGVPMHQDSSYYAEALPPERAAEMYRPFGAGVRAPESLIGGSERVIVSLWIPMWTLTSQTAACALSRAATEWASSPSGRRSIALVVQGPPWSRPTRRRATAQLSLCRWCAPTSSPLYPVLCYTRACMAAYCHWLTP